MKLGQPAVVVPGMGQRIGSALQGLGNTMIGGANLFAQYGELKKKENEENSRKAFIKELDDILGPPQVETYSGLMEGIPNPPSELESLGKPSLGVDYKSAFSPESTPGDVSSLEPGFVRNYGIASSDSVTSDAPSPPMPVKPMAPSALSYQEKKPEEEASKSALSMSKSNLIRQMDWSNPLNKQLVMQDLMGSMNNELGPEKAQRLLRSYMKYAASVSDPKESMNSLSHVVGSLLNNNAKESAMLLKSMMDQERQLTLMSENASLRLQHAKELEDYRFPHQKELTQLRGEQMAEREAIKAKKSESKDLDKMIQYALGKGVPADVKMSMQRESQARKIMAVMDSPDLIMDKGVVKEVAIGLASMLTGGSRPAQQTIREIIPSDIGTDAAQIAQYITKDPQKFLSDSRQANLKQQIDLELKQMQQDIKTHVDSARAMASPYMLDEDARGRFEETVQKRWPQIQFGESGIEEKAKKYYELYKDRGVTMDQARQIIQKRMGK